MTVSHFARILAHLRLLVADVDFHLLLKKFMKSSYTVNYVAFLEVIDRITKTLTEQQMLDVGGDLIARFPTRCITAALPKLPRPEVGNIALDTVFGPQAIFHPVSRPPQDRESLHRVLRRIQQYAWRHRIRVAEFFKVRTHAWVRMVQNPKGRQRSSVDCFITAAAWRLWPTLPHLEGKVGHRLHTAVLKARSAALQTEGIGVTLDRRSSKDFDPLRSGRVTKEQFRRCLDAMGLAGTQRLYLAEPDIEVITVMYTDPNDEQRVIHTAFTDDINHGNQSLIARVADSQISIPTLQR